MDAMLSAAAFTGLSQWVLYSFKKKKSCFHFIIYLAHIQGSTMKK